MKKLIFMLVGLYFLSTPVLADSVVKPSGEVVEGKITAVSDDVIYVRKNFVDTVIVRQTGVVPVEDIVLVRAVFSGGEPKRVMGKVYFADTDYVKIKTTDSEIISIPRIQVKSISIFSSK